MVDYKSVAWNQGDLTTRDKLQRMANNDEYLRTKMPAVRYTYGTPVDLGTKILAGRFIVTARTYNTFANTISFGTFFSPSCSPIVTVAAVSEVEDEIFIRVTGQGQLKPTASGMIVRGRLAALSGAKTEVVEASFYVDWIAVGF